MADFTEPSDFTFKHTAQVDVPNISANDMKAYLDSQAKELRDYLIATHLPELEVKQALVDAHYIDYTLQVPYQGTVTNTGNAYAIATPDITALTAGMAVSVKINADSTGAATLDWDSKGAKGIKKANGVDAVLKNGGVYTLRYDGTNFILQGEGASGNAVASDLLSGKTASTDAGEIVGTLVQGKKFASGVITAPSSSYPVSVSGLTFTPNAVMILLPSGITGGCTTPSINYGIVISMVVGGFTTNTTINAGETATWIAVE